MGQLRTELLVFSAFLNLETNGIAFDINIDETPSFA